MYMLILCWFIPKQLNQNQKTTKIIKAKNESIFLNFVSLMKLKGS